MIQAVPPTTSPLGMPPLLVLARTLNRDPLYATRLQLTEQALPLKPTGVESVVAVSGYGGEAAYKGSAEGPRHDVLQNAVLLEVVFPRLSVPAADAPLERIIEPRRRESFEDAVFHLRKWQGKVLPDLLNDPRNRDKHLHSAATDFDRWVKQ